MADNHTSYVLDLKGNLDNRARQYSRALQRFSRTGRRSLDRLGRAAHHVGRGIDALGNQYTALLTGGAAFATGRYLTNLDERFTRLGITAQISAEQVDALKKRIFETAQMPNIRVDPAQITSAVEAIVEKTGDLEFARNNLRNIGLAVQATGAMGTPIGDIMAEFQKMGVEDPDKILRMLDLLNVQGKEGAFTLENLAKLGPRVITAYTSVTRGAHGPVKAIREMGAALQIIRMGTGSAEGAATAFEAVIRDLTNPKKIQELHDLGIQVFDPEALKRDEEVLRPINELLLEIQKKSGGKRTILGQIFGEEAIRAFNAINPEDMARFYNVKVTGQQTIEDARRAAGTMSAALTSLMTALQKFASANLADDIEALADAINSIDPETLEKILKVATSAAVGGGGLFAARKLYQGGRAIGGLFGHRGGAGVIGETIDGFADVQKVYVVNMGGGRRGLAGAGAGAESSTAAKQTTRRGGRLRAGTISAGKMIVRGGLVIGAVAAASALAYQLNQTIDDPDIRAGQIATNPFVKIGALIDYYFGNNDASKKMEGAAERMENAAKRMESAESTINLEIDQTGRANVRGVTSHLRDPYTGQHLVDPYAGPMMAGGG